MLYAGAVRAGVVPYDGDTMVVRLIAWEGEMGKLLERMEVKDPSEKDGTGDGPPRLGRWREVPVEPFLRAERQWRLNLVSEMRGSEYWFEAVANVWEGEGVGWRARLYLCTDDLDYPFGVAGRPATALLVPEAKELAEMKLLGLTGELHTEAYRICECADRWYAGSGGVRSVNG